MLLKAYNRSLEIARGKGIYLYDKSGKEYIDFTSGIAVCSLGHGDEKIAKVLHDQAKTLVHTSNLYLNSPAIELASALANSTNLHSCFFTNSGTESNEAALKFARKHGKSINPSKTRIIAFSDGFHGRTMGSLSATMNPKYKKDFMPLVPNFMCCPFNNDQILEFVVNAETCAVILEPIQGEGGVNAATPEFLLKLRQLCSKHNVVLIFDEIQCGLSRSGSLYAHQKYNILPDILTLAKPLGNGFPIGATLLNKSISNIVLPGDHGTTFGGSPLACSVGLHCFNRLSDLDLIINVNNLSSLIKSNIISWNNPNIQVRGSGLLLGLRLHKDPKSVIIKAQSNGLLLVAANHNTIRIIPPLISTKSEILKGLEILKDALI